LGGRVEASRAGRRVLEAREVRLAARALVDDVRRSAGIDASDVRAAARVGDRGDWVSVFSAAMSMQACSRARPRRTQRCDEGYEREDAGELHHVYSCAVGRALHTRESRVFRAPATRSSAAVMR